MSCIPNILLIQGKESTSSSVPIIFLKFLLEIYLCRLQLKLVRLLILFVVLFHSVDTMCIDYNISYFNIYYFQNIFHIFYFSFQTTLWNGRGKLGTPYFGSKETQAQKVLTGVLQSHSVQSKRQSIFASLTSSLVPLLISLAVLFFFILF